MKDGGSSKLYFFFKKTEAVVKLNQTFFNALYYSVFNFFLEDLF